MEQARTYTAFSYLPRLDTRHTHSNALRFLLSALILFLPLSNVHASEPIVDPSLVFAEKDGLVAVEAEHFFQQTATEKRAFHLTTADEVPNIKPDGDPAHAAGASGGAYIEVLPDTRRTHADKLIRDENFSPQPGKMAVLHYIKRAYPAHWGDPPLIQTRDLRPLPGGYGRGSSTLAKWIQVNLDRDAERASAADNQQASEPPKGSPTKPVSDKPLVQPRKAHGDGSIEISGESKRWHNLTLTLDGPFAHEQDNQPNPFTDYRMHVTFTHADGQTYIVPGYFAADGDAGNTSAEAGTKWRAHFAPDKTGQWDYEVTFQQGELAALDLNATAQPLELFHGKSGSIQIASSDKKGRDLRAHGRLQYVGKHYLQFAGSGRFFLKAGADAPETLLGYRDFDDTVAGKPNKVPLKTWSPHIKDWKKGDPTWKGGKGKGLIGAINYLAGKGGNVFSFLTYNAGGDGDNVWPFIHRDDKLHYDCSKLDQWATVFEHGTRQGMYLHFKMQETENDDHIRGKDGSYVPESLDGGNLGVQRKLYCRELIARFGHNLALNWNLGEENTQSTAQQQAMIDYIAKTDPYDHNIVVHTFPNQQDKVYRPLLGQNSRLTGVSLQNSSLKTTHAQTVKWATESAKAGKPWIVAFDESGSAAHAQCPDLGYQGFDGHDRTGKMVYTQHEVRKQTLWGVLMGGGAGCEYYFGYQFAENDLVCEDWRSRDQSWDYCRIAIEFFHQNEIPFWEMQNMDQLVGNPDHGISKYCFAKPNDTYLVYLPHGGTSSLDLGDAKGEYNVQWFDPRGGGQLQSGSITSVSGGETVELGQPPADRNEDWLVVVRS